MKPLLVLALSVVVAACSDTSVTSPEVEGPQFAIGSQEMNAGFFAGVRGRATSVLEIDESGTSASTFTMCRDQIEFEASYSWQNHGREWIVGDPADPYAGEFLVQLHSRLDGTLTNTSTGMVVDVRDRSTMTLYRSPGGDYWISWKGLNRSWVAAGAGLVLIDTGHTVSFQSGEQIRVGVDGYRPEAWSQVCQS